MLNILSVLICVAVTGCVLWGISRLSRNKLDSVSRGILLAVGVLGMFVSFSAASWAQPQRTVTVIGLGQKNEAAQMEEITIARLMINGEKTVVPDPVSGEWTWLDGEYRWFVPGDERRSPTQTDQVIFSFPVLDRVELVFSGNVWKGMAEIKVDQQRYTVDTYREKSGAVTFPLPTPPAADVVLALGRSVAAFTVCLLSLCALGLVLVLLGRWLLPRLGAGLERHPLFQRLASFQFLFEELVKRDFKKKYKRTILGMAWSVLSPLLTLLVMRLVFTQFFGRATAHYTTYLFCGNLIFSYFNEATSQGMTTLLGNAGIFTKVNVPKYLFLFSKNVQTLINFALTLSVFFVFCILDQITFTWMFVCLLYPICCLVLFNIGVGLILSALYVFFRDIQYLWSVFTMLLMYMSAIFYTIDSYTPVQQNLFLLNPVYLFIRYFRKIVIEATIPSLWFHLLMLAYTGIALGVGCRMYKKNNTKFLYYV